MNLLEKIEQAKRMAEALANCTLEKHKEFVRNYSFQSDLQRIVNNDLIYYNESMWDKQAFI